MPKVKRAVIEVGEKTPYRFPPNNMASDSGLACQAEKVMEEAAEAKSAVLAGLGESDIAHEAWDVIQAVEGVLREMPLEAVAKAHRDVVMRCMARAVTTKTSRLGTQTAQARTRSHTTSTRQRGRTPNTAALSARQSATSQSRRASVAKSAPQSAA